MSFSPVKGAEPIPGYQLVERLGTGGYGAVWKATAPGGLAKAIKIVFGELGGFKAEQELRALQRIKEVRHPFLLSLERIEIVEGQLLIVTELAEASLLDRFHQHRNEGLPGIPRDELLRHLRDTADALDYMSEVHGLQHLDIKPQNLLLVGGRIKVADFGLVKDLLGTSVTATGGVTPLYAPPEAFDGRISRFSDQYSLAVVYQEMLTGIRPFPGTTIMQLAQQHMNGRPLLDPLPPSDRPAIARAMAKTPQDRFPSCRALVEELLLIRPAGIPNAELPPPIDPAEQEAMRARVTEVDRIPSGSTLSADGQPAGKTVHITSVVPTLPPTDGRIALRPTLFVGIGALAGQTLRRLKNRLLRHFGTLAAVPSLRLLLLDTDRADLKAAMQSESVNALSPTETLLVPLQPQEYYRDKARDYLRWLDRRWFYGIPRDRTTEGLRPIGRLALVDNTEIVLKALRKALTQITSAENRVATATGSGQPLREENYPRVFLVASLGGGTSGMVVDLAYAIQQQLEALHLPREGLCGVLLHATSPKPSEVELTRVNARATLRELHHFSQSDQLYPGDLEHGLTPGRVGQPPFPDCYLVHLGDRLTREGAASATDLAADYLYLSTATTAAGFLDEYRLQTHSDGPATLRSFGLDRIVFPRRLLARLTARRFCQNFLQAWRGEVDEAAKKRIEQSCQQQVRELQLEADLLIDQLTADAEAILGESPDSLFLSLATVGETGAATEPAAAVSASDRAEAILRHIEQVLGKGAPLDDQPTSAAPHPVEAKFYRHAREVGSQVGQQLVDWLLTRVEDPQHRLKAAEHAARWFVEFARTTGEHFRTRLAQLRTYRHALRERLKREDTGSKLLPLAWLRTRKEGGELKKRTRRFVDFCWLRLMEIVYESVDHLLGIINRELSPLAQELVLSERKLIELAGQFAPAREREDADSSSPNLMELYPSGSATLEGAVAPILVHLSPDQLRQFEASFQAEVLDPQGGLWGILGVAPEKRNNPRATSSVAFWALLANNSHAAQTLKEKMLELAQRFILNNLQDVDAARLFVESLPDPNQLSVSVAAHAKAARPQLPLSSGWQHLLLLAPSSPAGIILREQVAQVAGDVPLTVLNAEADVRICMEAAGQSLRAVAANLTAGVQEDLVERILVRNDVTWSPL
jgi:hypothetical protein